MAMFPEMSKSFILAPVLNTKQSVDYSSLKIFPGQSGIVDS